MGILCAILGIAAFLFVFAACGSNLLYWYEALNAPCAAVPAPRPGLWTCLRIFWLSLGGYLIEAAVLPMGWFWERKPGFDPGAGRGPLVLVHGLRCNAGAWLYLAGRLKKAGWAVSVFVYSSRFSALENVFADLDAHIRAVELAWPGRKPVLAGHSLGGLLLRRWLLNPVNAGRAAGLITLGTPHGGSKMAALARSRLTRSLLPDSGFIADLKAASTPGVSCVSLVSPTDDMVLPAAGLLPPPGWKLRVTGLVSHFGMLYCPRVAGMLLEELENLPPAGENSDFK